MGQVVWAPSIDDQQYLVFVGWPSDARKLGIKYCYNRPCALYAVKVSSLKADASVIRLVTATSIMLIYFTEVISFFILHDENTNTLHLACPCLICFLL